MSAPEYPFPIPHEKVKRLAHNLNLPFFDARPIFAGIDPDPVTWRVSRQNTHPNEKAHHLVGALLAKELEKDIQNVRFLKTN